MIPVLFKFTFDTGFSQAVLYLVALAVVAYAAFSGWRGVQGPVNAKTGAVEAPPRSEQIQRALTFGVVGAAIAWLGLHYALPPTAFLGSRGEGLPIHTYGVMLATGFMTAVALAATLAQREWRGAEGLRKRDEILDLSFWVLLGGIGGSKLLFLIVNWRDYSGHLDEYLKSPDKIMDLLGGGLVFYGGLLGAMLMAFLYARKHSIQFVRLADICIPTVSLGQCFGRLGCFSAGCCWGDVAHKGFKLGVHFPGASLARDLFGRFVNTSSLAFQSQSTDTRWVVESTGQVFHQAVPGAVRVSEWAISHGSTLPVHPTQLYESVGQLCMFLLLLFMRRYRRFHGMILGIWLMGYAVLRTTVELFRGDLERGTLHGLLESLGMGSLALRVPAEAWFNISTSQFISLCMFVAGGTLLYRRGRKSLQSSGMPPSALPAGA